MVRGVSEQNITWEKFQRYFKERYLTECFYNEKAREFHDLRLGQQTMDKFVTRFTSLLRYVPYIREEKAKSKQKGEILGKKWVDKKSNKLTRNIKDNCGGGNKGFAKGKINKNSQKNSLRLKPPIESRTNEKTGKIDNEGTTRPPVQCWGCGGPHYVKNYPQQKGTEQVSQVYEASTIGNVERSLPNINAALEDRQAEYQPTMVEFKGKLLDLAVTVLIDPGATLSYISPRVVEHCKLQPIKFKDSWLVQLAIGAKRWVLAKVKNCPLKIAG
eukprot:PITA_30523